MFCKTNIIYYVLLRQADFEPSTSPLPSKTTSSKVNVFLALADAVFSAPAVLLM
jgi:hypothetical protein